MTALAFFASIAPVQAQTSALFPLDHFWTHALDAPLAAAPAADGDRVYVPLQTGRLLAIDPRTNAVAWSVELAADSTPLVADGRLFVHAAEAVHALDAATGAITWRLPAGPLAAPLAHRGGWLIVALADGGLQGVRAEDGAVVWARAMGSPLSSAPGLDGDLLVAALADGRLVAMDITTGAFRWPRTLGAPAGGLTLSGDRIFAGTRDGYFWSLETSDGDADWPWRLGARLIGAPAADAEHVYAVTLDNVVRGFSRGSGNMRWNHPLPTRPLGGPQLVEGLLVMTSGDVGAPGLTYISAETGRAAGRTPALPKVDETTRTQFPAAIAMGTCPAAIIATATTSGDWQLHGYRQTFLTAAAGPILWGKLYEVLLRLDIGVGGIVWGERITLAPPVPQDPRVPQVP